QRTIFVVDASKIAEKPGVRWIVKKTGAADTVAGFPCEKWLLTEGVRKVEACVAKFIGYFPMAAIAATPRNVFGFTAELEKESLFALRAVAYDPSGSETIHAEATRVERKSIPESYFKVPANFRIVESPPTNLLAATPK